MRKYLLFSLLALAGLFTLAALINHSIRQANILANPSLEQLDAKGHPANWSVFNSSGRFQWEACAIHPWDGNRCGQLKLLGTHHKTSYVDAGLIAGISDGYSGARAYTVQPSTHYYLSFRARGDMTSLKPMLLAWDTPQAPPSELERIEPDLQSIDLGQNWTQYVVTVRTGDNTVRAAPFFYKTTETADLPAGGEEMYIDQVYFGQYPALVEKILRVFGEYKDLMLSLRTRILRTET